MEADRHMTSLLCIQTIRRLLSDTVLLLGCTKSVASIYVQPYICISICTYIPCTNVGLITFRADDCHAIPLSYTLTEYTFEYY